MRTLRQEIDEDAVLRVLDVVVISDALSMLDVAVGELIAREFVGWLEACGTMIVDGHILHVAIGVDSEHNLNLIAHMKLVDIHNLVAFIFLQLFLYFNLGQAESLGL